MANKIPVEIRAKEILLNYNGTNDYLLELKSTLINKKTLPFTPNLCTYIINNHKVKPVIINNKFLLHKSLRKYLQLHYKLQFEPEFIYVNKLLTRKKDNLHIWGCFSDDCKYYFSIFIDKNAMKKTKNVELPSFDDYKRPPLPHQLPAIKTLLENDKFILADDMGLAKTSSAIVAAILGNYQRILVVCPATLKLNWKKEISIYDDPSNISVIEGSDFTFKKWTIINYDILKNFHFLKEKGEDEVKPSIIDFYKYDLIIADECFPYKTLVDTDKGKLEIGNIVENCLDVKILSYNLKNSKLEYKRINRWIKKESNTILKISLQNEKFIECTPNHKIYVKDRGYIRADKILKNDELYTLQKPSDKKLSILWKTDDSNRETEEKSILRYCLFSKMENEPTRDKKENSQSRSLQKSKNIKYRKLQEKSTTCKRFIRSYEKKQPNDEYRNVGENEKFIERENLFIKRWERKNNNTRTKNEKYFGCWLGTTLRNKNIDGKNNVQILTASISSRFRKRRFKNRNRGGRKNTSNKKMEISGQKKNGSIRSVRVENIEILESGCGRSNRKLFDEDKRVYNIEVADNHNYFADNILVSNCHYLKNASANRTKLFNDFALKINTRWLLTGTPITSKPINLYNLLLLCDSPLANNWVSYVRRYCAGKQFNRKGTTQKYWVTDGATNLEELNDYISDILLRRLKKDSVELPQKTVKPIFLPLSSSKRYNEYMIEYQEWYNDMVENGLEPKPTEHLTQLIKIRQLLSEDKMSNTIKIAEDLIEEGHKVIIFSCFTNTIRGIHEHFGKESVLIDGAINSKNRDIAVEKFQNDKKVKVFCGNLIAAGAGITLTEGTIVIFNDLDWLPGNHAQASDRAYRIGQTKDVHIIYMLIDDTLDNMMYTRLQEKIKEINTVMGDEHTEDVSLLNAVVSNLLVESK